LIEPSPRRQVVPSLGLERRTPVVRAHARNNESITAAWIAAVRRPCDAGNGVVSVVMSKNTHVAGIVSVVGFVNKLDLQVE